MKRREELIEAATDYALEAGLIGLSLRPLAAAIGTSDRMLIYHLGSKDELIAGVLRVASDRSATQIQALPPARSVRAAVLLLWHTVSAPDQQRCQRMYVEAAALGLFGTEPYVSAVRDANARWLKAIEDFLVASGAPTRRAKRMAALVDAAFMGFQLDLPLDGGGLERTVCDLADAIGQLADP